MRDNKERLKGYKIKAISWEAYMSDNKERLRGCKIKAISREDYSSYKIGDVLTIINNCAGGYSITEHKRVFKNNFKIILDDNFLKAFTSQKIAVNTKTEQEAKEFCNWMHSKGLKWSDGQLYRDKTFWTTNKEETCYLGKGEYSYISYYTENDYTIINFKDLIQEDNKFNKGDEVKIINKGENFSTYEEMAQELSATKWEYNKSIKSLTGKIIDFAKHEHQDDIVYLVDCGDREYLIGEDGLKLRDDVIPQDFIKHWKENDVAIKFSKERDKENFCKQFDSIRAYSVGEVSCCVAWDRGKWQNCSESYYKRSGYTIINFEDIKENKIMSYNVVRSFTFKDILDTSPCNSNNEVQDLMEEMLEQKWNYNKHWTFWDEIKTFKTLVAHKQYLIDNNWLEVVEPKKVFKPFNLKIETEKDLKSITTALLVFDADEVEMDWDMVETDWDIHDCENMWDELDDKCIEFGYKD